jgi:ABC-type Mn2+/Zn2+ transport system permease subunit
MKNINPFARNLLILALIALAVVVLDQEVALSVVGALVRVAFFIAIAVVAYFFWRDFGRREIAVWPGRALLVVDLGVWLSTSPNGREALALIVVAAISVYAGVRTWLEQRRVL